MTIVGSETLTRESSCRQVVDLPRIRVAEPLDESVRGPQGRRCRASLWQRL